MIPSPTTAAANAAAPPVNGIYQVGTLTYDRPRLAKLFIWLLLGDFCWFFMEAALPKLLPLQLDSQGVKATGIAWMMSTGSLAALIFSPFIGVWSDRLRTRWGRRRPFLFVSTPIMAAGLLIIPHVHNYWLLNLVVMVIQVMNVLQTVMLYLYADIMPASLMGRFMAAFRLVGFVGTLAFQYLLFPYFGTSPVMVWTVCAVVYLVVFQISLHMVREGDYPAPEPVDLRKMIVGYVKEGLTGRYMWMLWLTLGITAIAAPGGYFTDLFGKKQLHMTIPEIARMNAYAMIPTILLSMPCGWLIDKYGPRVIWGASWFVSGVVGVVAYFFIETKTGLQVFYLINACSGTLATVTIMPMLYAHLPRDKFGQFTSTQSLVVHSLIFGSTNLLGQLISSQGDNYRLALLYSGAFLLLTPAFTYLLKRTPSPFGKHEMALAHNGS
jgi:maltose/moltooligosaccharide transporter